MLWYPKKYLPTTSGLPHDLDGELANSLRKMLPFREN